MKPLHYLLCTLFILPLAQAQSEEPTTPAEVEPAVDEETTDEPAEQPSEEQPEESEETDEPKVEDENPDDTPSDETDTDADTDASDQPTDTEESDDDENTEEPTEAEKDTDPVVIRTEIPKTIRLSKDNTQLKLLAPWAPKPMQRAPIGWTYVPGDPEQAYTRKIKLSSGESVSLTIIPYVLAPEKTDGVVQVLEPGYQPERGYKQQHSVTAVLNQSSKSLEDAISTLDASISTLDELVGSLPKQNPVTPKPTNP